MSDEVGGCVGGLLGVIVGGSSLNVTNDAYDAYQVHVHRQLPVACRRCYAGVFHLFRGRLVGGCYRGSGGSVACGIEWGECGGVIACRIVGSGVWGLPDRFMGLTGHTESIAEVGPGVTVLASGPTCPVQLFRWGGNKWASQFHCEMDAAAMEARMRFFY